MRVPVGIVVDGLDVVRSIAEMPLLAGTGMVDHTGSRHFFVRDPCFQGVYLSER